jgi:hypothetical protein
MERQTDRQRDRQADGERQTDRHDEARSSFSQFCEKHLKSSRFIGTSFLTRRSTISFLARTVLKIILTFLVSKKQECPYFLWFSRSLWDWLLISPLHFSPQNLCKIPTVILSSNNTIDPVCLTLNTRLELAQNEIVSHVTA